jgi:asparagine synthase (glutamine-hydrolysing)
MCGISGFIARQGNLLPNSAIVKMTDLINHRGPDDEGFLFLNQDRNIITAGGERTPIEVWSTKTEYYPTDNIKYCGDQHSRIAFGHKRLSILDLTPTGHQPMSYKNGRYWIVYNGEIYNYRDIKNKLEKLGHHFRTRTDTETILAAYSEWGQACLKKFVGMWAFAIYGRDNNELFLARDRYGIKPLYYYFSAEGDLYFASEIKQFTVLDGWQPRMNPQRVYDQLVYSFTDHTDETMFSGVFQIPGGTYFKSSIDLIKPNQEGRIHWRKWYFLKRDPFKGSFNEAAKIFRKFFERAVKEHLNADVPVGTALSGGLDSSSIVCEVNRILQADGIEELQKTFSARTTYKKNNENKWMDLVLNHTNVEAYSFYPRMKDIFKMTQDIIWYYDTPYQSQSAFLGYNVYRLANLYGIKVLLNGQGADEYLGGYGQFTASRYANLAKNLRISEMLADIRNLQKINHVSFAKLLLNIISNISPTFLMSIIRRIMSSKENIKRIIDGKKLGTKAVHPYDVIPVGHKTVPEISEHFTFFSTLPKYLRWEDRNSMAHSVEARVPFLDHRLVEFAYNLPDDFLEKDGITKRVMREAMNNLLPKKIINRKDKMGFITPEELWVKEENPRLFRSKISEAITVTEGIIKPEALDYYDNVIKGNLPFDYTYWRLILFSEWVKKFQVKI